MTLSPVTRRERIAFALGDTGFNFVWQTIELYLLFYYVRVLGLAPELGAAIFLAGALADLLADPLIGALVDRTRGKIGPRNWVLLAGPPLGLALALAFAPVSSEGEPVFAVLIATHVLLRVCYSLGNIPYAALTARISPDPAMQTRLTGNRMQGAAIGGLIAGLVYMLLPLDQHIANVPVGAIVLGVLAQFAFAATWAGTRERVSPGKEPPTAMREELVGYATLLKQSAALRSMLVLIFFGGLACTLLNKGILFVFDSLQASQLGYIAALFPSIMLFVCAPVWSNIAVKVGTLVAFRRAAALNLLATAIAALLGGPAVLIMAVMVCAMAASVGLAVTFFALVPAVITSCEREIARDGCAARAFGLANLVRKLAQALAPQFIALSLLFPGISLLWWVAAAAGLALATSFGHRALLATI